jgi:hypothetical protein
MKWTGPVTGMGVKKNACRIFIANPEAKRSLGRPRSR